MTSEKKKTIREERKRRTKLTRNPNIRDALTAVMLEWTFGELRKPRRACRDRPSYNRETSLGSGECSFPTEEARNKAWKNRLKSGECSFPLEVRKKAAETRNTCSASVVQQVTPNTEYLWLDWTLQNSTRQKMATEGCHVLGVCNVPSTPLYNTCSASVVPKMATEGCHSEKNRKSVLNNQESGERRKLKRSCRDRPPYNRKTSLCGRECSFPTEEARNEARKIRLKSGECTFPLEVRKEAAEIRNTCSASVVQQVTPNTTAVMREGTLQNSTRQKMATEGYHSGKNTTPKGTECCLSTEEAVKYRFTCLGPASHQFCPKTNAAILNETLENSTHKDITPVCVKKTPVRVKKTMLREQIKPAQSLADQKQSLASQRCSLVFHYMFLTVGNGLEIRPSTIESGGHGLFATEDITKGRMITWYDGHYAASKKEDIDSSRWAWNHTTTKGKGGIIIAGFTSEDLLSSRSNRVFDSECGVMSICNTRQRPNCTCEFQENDTKTFFTLPDISTPKLCWPVNQLTILKAKWDINAGSELTWAYQLLCPNGSPMKTPKEFICSGK